MQGGKAALVSFSSLLKKEYSHYLEPVDETGHDLGKEDTVSHGGAEGCSKAQVTGTTDTLQLKSRYQVKWYSAMVRALTHHYTSAKIRLTHKSSMEQYY